MNIFAKKLYASPLWAIALAVSVLASASCTKDDDEENKVADDIVVTESFIGKMEVPYKDSVYVTEDVMINISNVEYTDSTKKADGTFDIVLYAVKFVPQMQISLDITVPGVTFKVNDKNVAEISGEGIIPIAMGKEFAMYKVSGLSGTITYNSLSDRTDDVFQFSLNFGENQFSYSGNFLNNSI